MSIRDGKLKPITARRVKSVGNKSTGETGIHTKQRSLTSRHTSSGGLKSLLNAKDSEEIPLIVRLGGSLTTGLSQEKFVEVLESKGISRHSPKFRPTQALLQELPDPLRPDEVEYLKTQDVFVSRAIDGELVIKDFAEFTVVLEDVYLEVEEDNRGHVATYIPQLAKVDPDQFGVAVCSVDGQEWSVGDAETYFSLQSISKVITYLLALDENGEDKVHKHVGREPSGAGFNERILNTENLPHNPYINSGAIMCGSLIKRDKHISERFDHVMDTWTRITGGSRPTFSNSTYLSERSTADRNFSLAHMMNEAKVFPEGTNLLETLELYFMLCSIEVTASMVAVAAGTLASGGVCPSTGERIFSERNVRDCLSLMASCGMNNGSGEFIFDMGFPAKSGISGGLLIVIPGIIGLCTWSPRTQAHANSYRGVRFCEQLVHRLDYHQFSILDSQYADEAYFKLLEHIGTELLFAIKRNDIARVRVCIASSPRSVNYKDYNKRTPLHIAASEGHLEIVEYLVAHGARMSPKDHFGNTPLNNAQRGNHIEVEKYLSGGLYTFPEKYGKPFRKPHGPLYAALDKHAENRVLKQDLIIILEKAGFPRSHYWKELYDEIDNQVNEFLTLDDFVQLNKKFLVLRKAIANNLVIAEWDKFVKVIQEIFNRVASDESGANDSHIPQLGAVDSNNWEMSFCSTSGQLYNSNISVKMWSVQSMTNIVNYLIAQELLGEVKVHQHVGKEPSGRNFNEFSLNSHGLPHNPTINSGALVIVSLIKPDETKEQRFEYILSQWKKLTLGVDAVSFDKNTFISEKNAVSRKWTLAYMLLDSGAFPDYITSHADIETTVELYFMTLALLVSTEKMAIIGSVLANGGVNPFTGERLFKKKHVRNALSIMSACGMYDWSGEFTFRVGIPAQSGAGGGILAVVPDLGGFCTWSPRLDKCSNSVRGVQFYRELTKEYNFHAYETLIRNKKDPTVFGGNWNDCRICNLLHAASKNNLVELKKELSFLDVNSCDYDGRTALHCAAEYNNREIVKYLLRQQADVTSTDRWGQIPQDCAKSAKLKKLLSGEEPQSLERKAPSKKKSAKSGKFSRYS